MRFGMVSTLIAPADYSALVAAVQEHFTDGLALVIGSGLSAAEGIPGMAALASHLSSCAGELDGEDALQWSKIQAELDAGVGLEAALLRHAPSDTLEIWIAAKTCELLIPMERRIVSAVIRGDHVLRLTTFLARVLTPTNALPILTPNYDRLIEVACEMAGFHADTTAVGDYAGEFDHVRSCMRSCRGIATRAKTTVLDHYPRAIVLKPHGSFDWYRAGGEARRCALDLDVERLIITPGINKYRAGYDSPFDKHRDLANEYINRSGRLLIVGYGFNDDHLQTHLIRQIRDGLPTLILAQSVGEMVQRLAEESPCCVCLSETASGPGVSVLTKGHRFEHEGCDLWDLGVLAKELLT